MVKMRTFLCCLFVVLFGAHNLYAQDEQQASEKPDTADLDFEKVLKKKFDFIFSDKKLKNTTLSAHVYSLSSQKELYSWGADKVLTPASAVKLFTGYVALKSLGPSFRWVTKVQAKGVYKDSVLNGDIYLQGGGDPSLVSERLYLLAEQFLRSGITRVRGNLYVDASIFDDVLIDPNRLDTSTDRAYNAPISGLSFNYNTTSVYFRPGDKSDGSAKVYVSPDTGYIDLVNQSKTRLKNTRYGLIASRIPAETTDKVLVKGTIPMGFPEQTSYFNVTHPDIYAGYALKHFLKLVGVRVSGKVLRKKVPSGTRTLAVIESLPLSDVVTLMNKFSNNFIADTLVKTIGYKFKGAPGSMKKGLEVMREEATNIGINRAGFKLVSGSGLTRENMMSAKHFTKIINAAYISFDSLPELLTSLPIAGTDGTMRSRLRDTAAFGSLRAKTGTLNGVSSLAGVVQSRGGELLAFSILMQNNSKSGISYRSWQNNFAKALADFNRKVD